MATSQDFELAFELVIGNEKGYVNNPADPGGETKYGISKRAYPNLDITNLTLTDAKAIYERDYWAAAHCPDYKPRFAFTVFDCAVNDGVGRAIRFVQSAVGVAQDGAYGPVTAAAVAKANAADRDDLVLAQEVHAQRILFMAGLDTWKTFGLGWSRRLAAVPLLAGYHWPAA